ncbi:MAG: GGDEF domain-containing response regulator [Thermoanaerobaculia bacterium]|nr:GGDEF domain-containing response regulator [Thermoanaerobaculia bacterium]
MSHEDRSREERGRSSVGTGSMRVLLLEDSRFEAKLIARVLSDSRHVEFEVEQVGTLREALARLHDHPFDLILADLMLPDTTGGVRTVRRLVAAAPTVPIVVLTRLEDEEMGLQLVRAGAQDFLTKDFTVPAVLVRTLRYAVERHRLVAALREARAEAQYLATHDRLTDLPNRYLLDDRLEEAIAYAERHGEKLAVLFLDLDDFKQINDTYGHQVGDAALRWMAARLEECTRSTDTVCRFAGDEFVIVQRTIQGPQSTVLLANRILSKLRDPVQLRDQEVHLMTSIGIALHPEDGSTRDTLLRRADAAMYEAKSAGGNRCALASPDLVAPRGPVEVGSG